MGKLRDALRARWGEVGVCEGYMNTTGSKNAFKVGLRQVAPRIVRLIDVTRLERGVQWVGIVVQSTSQSAVGIAVRAGAFPVGWGTVVVVVSVGVIVGEGGVVLIGGKKVGVNIVVMNVSGMWRMAGSVSKATIIVSGDAHGRPINKKASDGELAWDAGEDYAARKGWRIQGDL